MIGAIAKAVIGDNIGKVVDRLVPDKAGQLEARMELEKIMVQATNAELVAQIEVNKVEAANPNLFVSGWRPACGWICGAALGYNFILHPLIGYTLVFVSPDVAAPPAIDLGPLMTVLLGMLGLGGLRTYEKSQGVARQGWSRKS